MGFEGSGSFLGTAAGIVASIGSFVAHFFGITGKELLRLINYLKDHIVELSRALLNGVLKLGRALARVVVSFIRLTAHAIRTLALWANRKLVALEQYLKAKFKPVLEWLKKVKAHLDEFYKSYIKPIIDTIEFIRKLNSLLLLFHIDVLKKLDNVLARVEQKIEEPFFKIYGFITELQNWINRIVTADGLFQRLALIRSMAKYAPNWINGFWNAQVDLAVIARNDYRKDLEYPIVPADTYGDALGTYVRGDGGALAPLADELAAELLIAAGV